MMYSASVVPLPPSGLTPNHRSMKSIDPTPRVILFIQYEYQV